MSRKSGKAHKPNNWWLLSTSNIVMPYLWQLRKAPQFTYLTNPNDLPVFMNNQFLYGVDAEGAPSATLWFLSIAGTSQGSY